MIGAMVSGVEGAGDAITGGLIAAAIEPATGAAEGEGGNCLNCGAALTGAYCHQCGQRGPVHRTLTAFWHDLAHGVLHFEGKIWRTLPLLAWRPGELTRRYVHGERARFVSPIALFLFSVFLMFAIFSMVGGPFGSTDAPQANREAAADIARERGQLDQRIVSLQRRRDELAAHRQPTAAIDSQLRALRQERGLLGTAQSIVLVPSSAPKGTAKTIDLRAAEIDTGWLWLDHAAEKARDNPSLLLYKLQTNAYKFSWALIPISVPFVWLLFLHRRRYRRFKAYDHVVFVTYSIAFMTLLVVALSLIHFVVGDNFNGIAITLVPPVHMYRQLKGAYQLRTFSALWRTAFVLWFAFIAATLFFVLLLALGLLG
ncbi:MAG: hypothetical protein QOH47_2462 [Sphingomonadales bacterium]|jgi:hypothetical protein|nr:hypothetical protein [Sphingomonadales bacterium]